MNQNEATVSPARDLVNLPGDPRVPREHEERVDQDQEDDDGQHDSGNFVERLRDPDVSYQPVGQTEDV